MISAAVFVAPFSPEQSHGKEWDLLKFPHSSAQQSVSAGVGDQRYLLAIVEQGEKVVGTGVLFFAIIADKPGLNSVVREKLAGMTSIFGGNIVYFFEYSQCSEGNVLQITDGGGDNKEPALRMFGECFHQIFA